MTPGLWQRAAVWALWAQVASLYALSAFALWRGQFSGQGWLNAAESGLAALVLAWWTVLFSRVLRAQATPDTDGTWRALALTFPWLTALRASLWLVLLLGVLSGAAAEANPVALSAILTIWAGAIIASNAVAGNLVRLSAEPGSAPLRRRLREWLNASAALSLGMGVMNVVPVRGLGDAPDFTSQLAYGGAALLDVLATVLAYRALAEQGENGGNES